MAPLDVETAIDEESGDMAMSMKFDVDEVELNDENKEAVKAECLAKLEALYGEGVEITKIEAGSIVVEAKLPKENVEEVFS